MRSLRSSFKGSGSTGAPSIAGQDNRGYRLYQRHPLSLRQEGSKEFGLQLDPRTDEAGADSEKGKELSEQRKPSAFKCRRCGLELCQTDGMTIWVSVNGEIATGNPSRFSIPCSRCHKVNEWRRAKVVDTQDIAVLS